MKPNWTGMVFGWSVISSPGIHPRWLPLLKIEISLNGKKKR
jgi:hypothetical protein